MSPYTYEIALHPRYRDVDPNGHVNHAVYLTYMEEARAGYWEKVIGGRLSDAGLAIVSAEVDYHAELELQDTVTVAMRIEELGESSIPHAYRLSTPERTVATGRVIMVAFDREKRTSRPIPDDWDTAIRAYEADHGNPID